MKKEITYPIHEDSPEKVAKQEAKEIKEMEKKNASK